jgi:hypothetical protein
MAGNHLFFAKYRNKTHGKDFAEYPVKLHSAKKKCLPTKSLPTDSFVECF